MGNCFGKSTTAKRQDNWKATGIVSLRDSGLKALPANVLNISSCVKILDASNNRLTQFPEAQLGWPQLQRLVLASNLLQGLPPSISSLQQLKLLSLEGNKLTSLPAEIGHLPRLEQLLLQGNLLLALPGSIGSLKALKALNISRNQLQQLPEALGQCSNLQEIDASHNQLRTLPASLASLDKLKVLQLDNNSIQDLPAGLLRSCSSLHTLSLHDNPITPQQLAAAPGWEAFDQRRRSKYDKVIAGNALLNSTGLDEGVDRLLK